MAKRNLLLVDADPRSLRVLEVSLRKAGYSVTTSADVDGALELIELTEPDMIIADTRLPGKDGFALVAALKARHKFGEIPLVFLSSDPAVESRMRGLELGVEDYLTKPVYIREILTRVNLVMQRKEREGLSRTSKTRFAGALADMGLVDLLQTIDVSRKSGVLHLTSGTKRGAVYFHDGRVIDAELGELSPEAAIYRFLLWSEGEFELDFREVRREDKLGISTQGLLMEGMRRLDEVSRLQEQLPSMDSVLDVSHDELAQRLAEIPDEINEVLRLFDGRRTLGEVLDESRGDELATLNAINKLYFEGFLLMREAPAPEHEGELNEDLLIGALEGPYLPEDAEALLPSLSPEAPARQLTPRELPQATAAATPASEQPPARQALVHPATAGVSEPELLQAHPPSALPELAPADAETRLEPPATKAESDGRSSGLTHRAESSPASMADAEEGRAVSAQAVAESGARAAAHAETTRALTSECQEAGAASSEVREVGEPVAQETVALAAVKLKRVALHAEPGGERRKAAPRAIVESVRSDRRIRDPRASVPPPALEEGGDMATVTEPQQASISASPSADNVIPLSSVRAPAPASAGRSTPPESGRRGKKKRHKRKGAHGKSDSVPVPAKGPQVNSEPPAGLDEPLDSVPPKDFVEAGEPDETRAEVERFFSEPPPPPVTWPDAHDPDTDAANRSARRGKRWTASILAVGLISIGGFLVYTKLLMPVPEPPSSHVYAPTPNLLEALANQAPVAEAPPARAAAAVEPVSEEAPPQKAADPAPAAEPPATAQATPEEKAERSSAREDDARKKRGSSEKARGEPDPGSMTQADEDGFATLLARARKQGFRRAAESTYLQALAIQPHAAEALSGLAMLYLNQGKNTAARDRAREAIRVDASNSEAWIVLGAALSAAGDVQGAREAYAKCAALPSGKFVAECRRMTR